MRSVLVETQRATVHLTVPATLTIDCPLAHSGSPYCMAAIGTSNPMPNSSGAEMLRTSPIPPSKYRGVSSP